MKKSKKHNAITLNDQLKAIRKADREMEYEIKGAGWPCKDKAVKSKKAYDRKNYKIAL